MRKKLVLIVLIATVIIGGATAAVFTVMNKDSDAASTWREQYDLGMRYLSRGKYEKAVIAFKAAIKKDHRRANVYLGLADAYEAMSDDESARDILLKGYERTKDEEISDRLRELREKTERDTMPDILGMSLADATEALEELNIQVLVEHTFDDDAYINEVIAASVKPGLSLRSGQKVTLTVSDGPERVSRDDPYRP